MNIKQIIDKIAKEGSFNTSEYSLADRIDDVNVSYLKHIEIARQIGSTEPIRNTGETYTESFAITSGNTIFPRTIQNVSLQRIDFLATGASKYERLDVDYTREVDGYMLFHCMRFFIDEKYVYIEDARMDGTIRVTYVGGDVTTFTVADYSLSVPPTPTMLPLVFRPLLWLEPAMNKAMFYKKERFEGLKYQYDTLYALFYKHYRRNAPKNMKVATRTMRDSGTGLSEGKICC